MTNQGAFAAITSIRPEMVHSLSGYLKTIGDGVDEPGCPIPFRNVKSVHFMRWVILDEAKDLDGAVFPACLVLSTNYDLPLHGHLQELVTQGGQVLRSIYAHCDGFDPASTDLYRYLRRHQVGYEAFYVGTRFRTVEQIRNEQALRNEIEDFLNATDLRGKSPREIHAAIQNHVANSRYRQPIAPNWRWRLAFFDWSYIRPRLQIAAAVAIVALLVGSLLVGGAYGLSWWMTLLIDFAVALIGIAIAVVGFKAALWALGKIGGYLTSLIVAKEEQERANPITAPGVGAPLQTLVDREDQIVQNQLSNVVIVKPGWFRWIVLKVVLWVVHYAGRIVFTRGALGGIPTIHFARWVLLNRGRRLLFFSNFDGSWENYLGDFIDKAAVGLTAIWNNTVGCPPAHKLFVEGGARDEAAFKAWVRENQVLTDVWYSAYEELSVQNINNNSYIRVQLDGDSPDDKVDEWLKRF